MTNKIKTILWIAALVLVLIGAAALYKTLSREASAPPAAQSSSAASQPASGSTSAPAESASLTPAPDFSMQDAEGNTVSLSDFIGKPIVLNFWASWCGPCKSEMPDFDAVSAELKDDVQFMMVNLTDGSRETVETASAFIAAQGYAFPVFYDVDYEGASAYAVRSIPTTYFIDSDGNLQGYSAGSMAEETLRQGIALITNG